MTAKASEQGPEDLLLYVLTSNGFQKWQVGVGEPDKLYYESDVASLAREAMWPVWSAQGGEVGGSPAWLRVWLLDLSVSGGDQVAVLVAAINQHDTSPTVKYGVAQVRTATNAPPISFSSFCLLPSLSSMLVEGEDPKHYKLITMGDWAYVYNRKGVTMVELTGTEAVENNICCHVLGAGQSEDTPLFFSSHHGVVSLSLASPQSPDSSPATTANINKTSRLCDSFNVSVSAAWQENLTMSESLTDQLKAEFSNTSFLTTHSNIWLHDIHTENYTTPSLTLSNMALKEGDIIARKKTQLSTGKPTGLASEHSETRAQQLTVVEQEMCLVENIDDFISPLPTIFPDTRLAGSDGEWSIHVLLLTLHSDLLKDIFNTLSDFTETVVIIPDFKMSEISVLARVLYGVDNDGFVSGSILDTLGMKGYKNLVVIDAGDVNIDESLIIDSTMSEIEVIRDESNNIEFEIHIENPDTFLNISNGEKSDRNGNIKQTKEGQVNISVNENQFHQSATSLSCPICKKVLKTKKILKCHMKLKHKHDPVFAQKVKEISVSKSLRIQCTICNQQFHSRQTKEEKHPEVMMVEICAVCDQNFSSTFNLNRHITNKHNNTRLFECSMCGFKTKRKEQLKEHRETHNAEISFECDTCDFVSNRRRELEGHKQKCRGRHKIYQCENCDKKCVSPDALRMHKKVFFVTLIKRNFRFTSIFFYSFN